MDKTIRIQQGKYINFRNNNETFTQIVITLKRTIAENRTLKMPKE